MSGRRTRSLPQVGSAAVSSQVALAFCGRGRGCWYTSFWLY